MVDAVLFELLARGVAIGAFAVTGAALAADRRPTPARWVGALFFACAIAHVLDGLQKSGLPTTAHGNVVVWAMSVAATGLFWSFSVALFADEARFSPLRLWPAAALLALWTLARTVPLADCRPVWLAYNLLQTLLVVHALLIIWRGWRGDLVVERRRLRGPVMAAAAGYILILTAQDLVWISGLAPWRLPGLQAVALAVLGLAAAVALLRAEPALVAASPGPSQSTVAEPRPAGLTPGDQLSLVRLQRLMDHEEVWRREDLSIGRLAALVDTPEHQLRRLINGKLGHRNFAAYVNARRIAAAKTVLGDLASARTPVSSIAYELGFGSLGPFNRAFKAATGQTPTAWRLAALGEASPNLAIPV